MKKLFIWIVFLCIGHIGAFAQTDVHIHFYNTNNQDFTVSEYGKIYFNNGYLLIDEGTGVPFSFEVANIQKMTFDHTLDIETFESSDFKVYPNPASSFLKIESSQEMNHYQLFTLEGRLVLSGCCRNGESINVSDLSKGLYLIQVNGQTTKISKL